MNAAALPLLARGLTWHSRKAPARNSFQYSVYFLMLPMRAMRLQSEQKDRNKPNDANEPDALKNSGPLARNRWGLLSFYDRDHGVGESDALLWVESVFTEAGIDQEDCEIWLQTFPRVLGFVFKPISIWYLIRKDESLVAAVAEVNNTFGQRHIYLLSGQGVAWGARIEAQKVFHVSPFCDVSGTYQFKFTRSTEQIAAFISNDTLKTSWMGMTEPYTQQAALRAFLSSPLMTLGIVARIHWQAAKLWWKKTPFYKLPPLPDQFITHSASFSTFKK